MDGTMICVSLCAGNGPDVRAGMEEARKAGADLVEVRADFLHDRNEIRGILEGKPLPVLVTLRSAREGGRFEGTDDELFSFLENAASAGADLVDVEWRRSRSFSRGNSRVVLSFHDPAGTPEDLSDICARMQPLPGDLVKVAVRARGTSDLLRLLALPKPAILVAMGEFGEPLRILYGRYGGAMTFASLREGEETAPGQLSISRLVEEYRVREIDAETRIYGVMGNPVSHSRSPELFNRVFRHLGVNARYVRIPLDDPSLFRKGVNALDLSGVSVTLPHKSALVAALDEFDPAVAEMGAVNTVVVRDGRLRGFNTDAPGAVEAIREAASRRSPRGISVEKALVLGAGGVARAVAWGLLKEGTRVVIANRTLDRAEKLAAELGCDFLPWERRGDDAPKIVVNATRMGMEGTESPFPAERWREEMIVLDAVYTPRWTPFLREAKAAGAETVDGVALFLRQANLQCLRFLGRPIPPELLQGFESA